MSIISSALIILNELNSPSTSQLEPLAGNKPKRAPWLRDLRSLQPDSPYSLKSQIWIKVHSFISRNESSVHNKALLLHPAVPTFTHVADLLLEDVVAVFVHMCPQEVLEAVVDFQPGSHHGHPFPHSVAL